MSGFVLVTCRCRSYVEVESRVVCGISKRGGKSAGGLFHHAASPQPVVDHVLPTVFHAILALFRGPVISCALVLHSRVSVKDVLIARCKECYETEHKSACATEGACWPRV